MIVSFVVAVAENQGIGYQNQLLWHLPADLKHFKSITLGKPVLMGRKTFESIGKALPGRLNIILSRQKNYAQDGAVVCNNLEDAIAVAKQNNASELCIIGGEEIFKLAWTYADIIYYTKVYANPQADAFFPRLDSTWQALSCEHHTADEKHKFAFDFITYKKV